MTDIFNLAGKVALITGGNGGIGLGMARGLANKGADIAIWGTNADKNRAARAEIEAMGVRVADFICDVGDQAQVEASFAATLEALGRVDSCFVNAGVGGQAESFVSMTDDEWHRVLRVNLDGAFTQHKLRYAAWWQRALVVQLSSRHLALHILVSNADSITELQKLASSL